MDDEREQLAMRIALAIYAYDMRRQQPGAITQLLRPQMNELARAIADAVIDYQGKRG